MKGNSSSTGSGRGPPTTNPISSTSTPYREKNPGCPGDCDCQKEHEKEPWLFLDHLKKGKVLNWNTEGEVSYRGRSISLSNIIDLMSDNMRQKAVKVALNRQGC